MKRRINLVLMVAVLFGLVAAYGTYQYLKHMENMYKSSENFVKVAVAKVRIPARQVIGEQMVEIKEMPANYIGPSVIGRKEEVVGKIARSEIYPGEQIIKNKVASPQDPGEGLAMLVEPGRRAMTVAVNDVSGVAGLLKPGDHVDILATVSVNKDTPITSLIVQNVRVLAVNKAMAAEADAKQPQNGTLTLSVDPVEAQQLTLATEKGSIRALLRTPTDSARLSVPSTNMNHLVR
ncbi:MAG: Flp pilus assembly protein CpaB [Peptococcaceae bacterium]|nr:Flp pilus assembly protein CpaB [Peptococcaceae bacterium]